MPPNEKDKLNGLEDLKNKLFTSSYEVKTRRPGTFSVPKKNVTDSWGTGEEAEIGMREKKLVKKTIYRKFFIFSICIFILAIGYTLLMYYRGGNTVSNENIDISVLGNNFTTGGEEFPFVVSITNKNSSTLDSVDLVVEYPKGSLNDKSKDIERFREPIGSIAAGAVHNESLKIVLYGEQGSVRQIKISIEYRVAGSNATFVKDKLYDVSINSSPINISLDAPTEISPNQDLVFNIKETLNATKPLSNMLLKFDYPFGFQFVSAIPKPTFDNNVWDLGNLAPGVDHNISITGKMVGVFDGEEKTFRITSGSQSTVDKSIVGVIFNSLEHIVSIKKPFIETRLYINGVNKKEYASDTKTTIAANIRWVNNLDTKVNDVQIVAKLAGNALDRRSITVSNGFYNSLDNTITWDKNYVSALAQVDPGASGSLSFQLAPLSSVDVLNDPAINIDVSITGKQPLEGNIVKEIKSTESQIIRIISNLGLATKALYFSGPFTNTGPIPPTAEQQTTYTIVWSLSNTSNTISETQVRSSLPPWIRFVGPVSPSSEDLKYDDSTKEIIWNVGTLQKNIGTLGQGREVAFQVSIIPSLSQVGTNPFLINDAILTGFDDFAKVNVRVNRNALTTNLTNDPAFPLHGDRVVDNTP